MRAPGFGQDKSAIGRIQAIKEELERLRLEAERAERDGDLAHVAELRYGRLPQLEKSLAEAETEMGLTIDTTPIPVQEHAPA